MTGVQTCLFRSVSQTGELQSLQSLGITKINLAAEKTAVIDQGNLIGLTSTFETNDGKTHQIADVWLQTSLADVLEKNAADLGKAISSFGQVDNGNPTSSGVGALTALTNENASVASGVVAMASLLQSFDANGLPIGQQALVSTTSTVNALINPDNSDKNGLLASGT